jgi:hypothetical protein
MKHVMTMCVALMTLFHALRAQGPNLLATSNWLAAHKATLGSGTSPNWLIDLDVDELEVYITGDRSLVLVDRDPDIREGEGQAFLTRSMRGLGGTNMHLLGTLESRGDTILHGVYSGRLGGTTVLMHQYVVQRNEQPEALVRVISRSNGSIPEFGPARDEEMAVLLGDPSELDRTALIKR